MDEILCVRPLDQHGSARQHWAWLYFCSSGWIIPHWLLQASFTFLISHSKPKSFSKLLSGSKYLELVVHRGTFFLALRSCPNEGIGFMLAQTVHLGSSASVKTYLRLRVTSVSGIKPAAAAFWHIYTKHCSRLCHDHYSAVLLTSCTAFFMLRFLRSWESSYDPDVWSAFRSLCLLLLSWGLFHWAARFGRLRVWHDREWAKLMIWI